MARIIPDRLQGKGFLYSLVLGDTLTKRSEPGPLARLWVRAPGRNKARNAARADMKTEKTGD